MSKWTTIEHITSFLRKGKLGNPKEPTLWPSEASAIVLDEHSENVIVGKCRRATYFRYALANYKYNEEEYNHLAPLVELVSKETLPTDKYTLWIWKAGELYEEYITQVSKESGIYIDSQVNIYIPEHKISGKIDLIVINPETYKYRTVEVKSVYGYGANAVLGTMGERRKGGLGKPRDSHLMQIALYQWWFANNDEQFENASLIYGARDTGRYAEYEVRVPDRKIFYRGISPLETDEIESPITIDSIIYDGYFYVKSYLNSETIPPRDYELSYSQEKIITLFERGELNKADQERYLAIKDRALTNIRRIADGKKSLKDLKPVELGDWQCERCQFINICYNRDKTPKNI